jgi:hypothetical protein
MTIIVVTILGVIAMVKAAVEKVVVAEVVVILQMRNKIAIIAYLTT